MAAVSRINPRVSRSRARRLTSPEVKGLIYRTVHDRENPYFLLRRATAQDAELPAKALGVLVYLLSKPDGWEPTISDITTRFPDVGRDVATRIINETLTELGYARRVQEREKAGIFGKFVTEIYEQPLPENQRAALPENQGEPLPENPGAVNQGAVTAQTVENKRTAPLPENQEHRYYRDRKLQSRENTEQQQQIQTDFAAAAAAALLPLSAFDLETVKAFVMANRPHAKNPGGLAVHLTKTGEDDEEIAAWLEPQERREAERIERILRLEELIKTEDYELDANDQEFILANRHATPTFTRLAEPIEENLREFHRQLVNRDELPSYLEMEDARCTNQHT